MIRVPSVCLRCPQLSGESISLDGSRAVIKRVPIFTDLGELQPTEMGALTPADYPSCAHKASNELEFRLTSADGTLILMGGDVSLTLVFSAERPM